MAYVAQCGYSRFVADAETVARSSLEAPYLSHRRIQPATKSGPNDTVEQREGNLLNLRVNDGECRRIVGGVYHDPAMTAECQIEPRTSSSHGELVRN